MSNVSAYITTLGHGFCYRVTIPGATRPFFTNLRIRNCGFLGPSTCKRCAVVDTLSIWTFLLMRRPTSNPEKCRVDGLASKKRVVSSGCCLRARLRESWPWSSVTANKHDILYSAASILLYTPSLPCILI